MVNEFGEMKRLAESMTVIMNDLAPRFQQIKSAIIAAYEVLWDIYIQEGAPYGETPEGLRRWFEEA